MYLCAKSIPIANKLVSFTNRYKQKFDQTTALLENGQKMVKKT